MLDDLFVEKSASFQLIEIDNTKEASVNGKWKDPGAALYIQLLNAMYMAPDNESDLNDPRNKYTPDYLKETYLIAPINKIKYGPYGMTPFSRSGCKYPHHVIRKGKLVVHIQGLKAAYARAKQMGIFSGEVKEHLERHYKELGLYEGSKMQLDESMNQNFQDIENYIGEETGIDLYSTKDLIMLRDKLKEMMHKYKQHLESVEHTVSQKYNTVAKKIIEAIIQQIILIKNRLKWDIETNDPTEHLMRRIRNKKLEEIKIGDIDAILLAGGETDSEIECVVDNNDMIYEILDVYKTGVEELMELIHATYGCKIGFKWIDKADKLWAIYMIPEKSLSDIENGIQESFQWIDRFFEQMEDIENFEIRMIDEKDYTDPNFLEWLYKLDEFQPEEQGLVFDMLHASTTHGNYVYGYFINGIMRGFIRIRYKDTFNAYAISLLFVDPSFHNLGIGSKLLQSVIDQFGNKDIVLNVFTDNIVAIRIYKKFGFVIEETIDCSNDPECPDEFKDRQQYRMRRIGTKQIDLRESKFFESEEASPPHTPTEEKKSEEASGEKEPSKKDEESYPKKVDRQESDKNGVRRKKLYIAFIEWAKEYNPKNIFGSIFDKDVFQTVYPFVPNEMRYFYRLANPMLCVLAGNLTFFSAGELKKLNAKNSRLSEFMIFAATDEDLRVFNNKDKKIYRALEENGMIKLDIVLGETFDTYIQNMINQGDILNGPIDDEVIKK